MDVIQEQYRTGEFLISEAAGSLSRAQIAWDGSALGSNTVVQGGTVYSLEALSSVTVSAKPGNTGNGTVSPVEPNLVPCQIGAYLVTMTGATTFAVTAPDGSFLNGGEFSQSLS